MPIPFQKVTQPLLIPQGYSAVEAIRLAYGPPNPNATEFLEAIKSAGLGLILYDESDFFVDRCRICGPNPHMWRILSRGW